MRKIFYNIPFLNKIVNQRDALLERNFILEEENERLIKESMACKGFQDIFLSPWTDEWKKFYNENYSDIPDFMERLKKGIDDESKDVVDLLWEKIIYLIPYNRYKKSFLYKTSDFFTEKELEDQKKEVDLSKYSFPEDVNIETPIFTTKNGLIFLPKVIQDKLKGGVILDAGAYIGDSSLIFCEYAPKKIYAFEPVDVLHEKLKETIKLNRIENIVEPVKLGLGDTQREVEIYGVNSAASLHAKLNGDSQIIKLTTIDDFVQKKGVCVNLIKLDVEGSEQNVIQGAVEVIKNDKPILLISIYHRPDDFFFIKPFIEKLDLGYKFMIRKTSSFRVTSETVLIGYVE